LDALAITAPFSTYIYTLSLHDALPIYPGVRRAGGFRDVRKTAGRRRAGPALLRAEPGRAEPGDLAQPQAAALRASIAPAPQGPPPGAKASLWGRVYPGRRG